MLPERCDVAVIGGGLAGLLAADRLARAGVSVVLVGDAPGPAAASGRSLGIVALGWIDSPARLVSGLGEATARGLHVWSALAMESLAETAGGLGVSFDRCGSWRVSLDEKEQAEWRESAPLLASWGLTEARAATGAELGALAEPGAVLSGAFVPGDGLLDVPGLMAALRARFLARGGLVVSGAGRLDERAGAPLVRIGDRELACELAVVAAGAMAPSVHPFFGPCVYPVRLQGQDVGAAFAPGVGQAPVIARHRFEAWHRGADGAVRFVGCRWAEQPEMEAGVTDDGACSERVSETQDAFLERRLGVARDAQRRRWSGIVAYTCDGLPLVGPLPGAPKVISLVGWAGWGLGLMARAVDEVTAAMLGEPAPDGVSTPAWLTARRLV